MESASKPTPGTSIQRAQRGVDWKLPHTPGLAALLERLRAQLVRLCLMQGLGALLAVASAWLLWSYVADRNLRVPWFVRAVHLLVFALLCGWILWRHLLRPLWSIPGRRGLAILLERTDPASQQLLVSAVEFQRPGAKELGDPDLVQRVLQRAELAAAQASPVGVFDARLPRQRLALGLCLALLGLGLWAAHPGSARIFWARFFLQTARWPKNTYLAIGIEGAKPIRAQALEQAGVRTGALAPGQTQALGADGAQEAGAEDSTSAQSEAKESGRHAYSLARGSDLTVIVQARGQVPSAVELRLSSGQRESLAASGRGTFRTVLRSVQEPLELYAVGGDDTDMEPRISVSVVDAPDVEALSVAIEPPGYSGLAARLVADGGDVQVLAGSKIQVVMRPRPAGSNVRARLLPEDRLIDLAAMPWPAQPGAPADPQAESLGFEFLAERSLRYRFEITSAQGLSNPNPGLYAVDVRPDKQPTVEWLAPTRMEVEQVWGGALRLRARAEDDFAVSQLELKLTRAAQPESVVQQLALEPANQIPRDDSSPEAGMPETPGRVVLGGTRLEIQALLARGDQTPTGAEASAAEAAQAAEGEVFELVLEARDNRPANAGVARSSVLRVRMVSSDDFLRRLQDRLARARTLALDLEALQREKSQRTRELLEAIEPSSGNKTTADAGVAAALAGQRRAQADSDQLARELSAALEGVLYARIDPAGERALEVLDLGLASSHSRGFQLAAWRALDDHLRSSPMPQGLCAQLGPLMGLGLTLAFQDTSQAVKALERASTKVDTTELRLELQEARTHQTSAESHVAEIVERLAEWDNFQSVLSLTREIISRQKTIKERLTKTPKESVR